MSTTVTYKGETLTTVSNATKTLTTHGKYLEDNITLTDVSSSAPTLQSKSVSYTPSETAQSQTVTPDSGYDGLDEVSVSVGAISSTYVGSGITRRSSTDLTASGATVTAPTGYYASDATKTIPNATLKSLSAISGTPTISVDSNGLITATASSGSQFYASLTSDGGYVAPNTEVKVQAVGAGVYSTEQLSTQAAATITPTTSSQTAVAAGKYTTGAVTVAAMPSGTAGTPTATKGAVSNHSVSVTPSVTNTTGYITGSTKTGTAVTVSASELVSGSETKTENGTYDVTNLAEIVVAVEGGGGGGVQIGKTTKTLSSAASSIQFTGLSGNPTSFVVTSAEGIATNTSGVTAVVFDGTSLHGQTMTTQVTADTGFTKSYSNGTLTITATTASFQAVEYKLVYTYGGSASDIKTADVQVGSGATSITFPVSGRPAYWSCIFKGDFSTSSGYQRVIEVVNDGSSIYGLAMDSSAHAATSWTATYSGGNLTISSQSTNVGGYFHQPNYYQLTYYVDESAPQYQSKTVTPTTSQQTVTPDTGYDALSEVTVNAIPSEYIIPTGNLAITQNGTGINVAQYATVSVNVSGGGTLTVATKTLTHTATGQTLSFTSLSGQPKYWFLRATTNVSSSGSTTYYYVTDCFYDGTNIKGNTFRIGSTRRVQNITSGISQSYSNGTLTITAGSSSTATPGQFYGASNFGYELVYIY